MSVPTKMINFYRFPSLDARIAIEVEGDPAVSAYSALCVSFMAKGNAYKGKGADRKLYARNPDRTAAVDAMLPELAKLGELRAVRVGKTANEPDYIEDLRAARKAYSAGGNYRFDLLFDIDVRITPALIVERLGLVRCENRPVPFAFV